MMKLYNTMTRSKQEFVPIDKKNVRVYACGPTVYDRIHVGNARPLVVFDVLVRLLRYHYGADAVKYVRNITDVDDKINERALTRGVPIDDLTAETTRLFHEDCAALNVLPPDEEPRATGHIPEMVAMIKVLIEKGHAYEAEGHVLFDVASRDDYGALSRRGKKELQAGARVEVAPYKKNPGDFVLWKPSADNLPGWESPWGRGRPGWHIECSAMSAKHLGETFDIHAGGLDLIFPHHENEIAQSCCAFGTDAMANYWVHNGYVTIMGEKMAKSEGNVITVAEAVAIYGGEAVRLALLSTHYRSPVNLSNSSLLMAKTKLERLYDPVMRLTTRTWNQYKDLHPDNIGEKDYLLDNDVIEALDDDLNTSFAVSRLSSLRDAITPLYVANKVEKITARNSILRFISAMKFLGFLGKDFNDWVEGGKVDIAKISRAILTRKSAREMGDYAEADRIRDKLEAEGIILEDSDDGTTWRRK